MFLYRKINVTPAQNKKEHFQSWMNQPRLVKTNETSGKCRSVPKAQQTHVRLSQTPKQNMTTTCKIKNIIRIPSVYMTTCQRKIKSNQNVIKNEH